jgi:hypothetical protein
MHTGDHDLDDRARGIMKQNATKPTDNNQNKAKPTYKRAAATQQKSQLLHHDPKNVAHFPVFM